jgi:DNA-binding CsgD family transcriptional regulator
MGADVAGDLRAAAALLVEARRADPTVRGSLRAAVAASHVLINVDGDVNMAHRLLAGVLHDTPSPPIGVHVDGCEEALLLLLELCLFAGRLDFWNSCRALLERFPEALPPVLHVLAQLLGDPAGVNEHHVRVVEAAVRELPSENDPRVIEQVCMAAWFMDRAGSCRDALWRLVRDGRSGGAVATAISAMATLASDAYYTGQWDECEALVDEGLALCDQHGYELLRWSFLFARAMVCAARGQLDVVPALVAEIDAWAAPRGMRAVSAYARQVEVLAALGEGDVDRAFTQAGAVCAPGTLVVGVPQALFLTLDLVVAAVESGRPEQARRHAAVVQSAGISRHAPRLRLLTAASAAVSADEEHAGDLYRQALNLPGISAWPFDTARVQLLFGQHLHRAHGGEAGRGPLTQAHATLRRLGADPWTARAAAALRAAGSPTAAFTGPVHLSAQELEIARLAAAGLSNRQIGQRLYLSHRTIGAHLYRIFPKLGITTRAALRDALDRADTAPPGSEAAS